MKLLQRTCICWLSSFELGERPEDRNFPKTQLHLRPIANSGVMQKISQIVTKLPSSDGESLGSGCMGNRWTGVSDAASPLAAIRVAWEGEVDLDDHII